MLQPEHAAGAAQPATDAAHGAAEAAHGASEAFNAGDVIIGHVANSPLDQPLIHLPTIAGIDMSVTKHVFMLWVVAGLVLAVGTLVVRRYARQPQPVPTGFMGLIELGVDYLRESVEPSLGRKWVDVYLPYLLTLAFFILVANGLGLIPIFDLLAFVNHTVLHLPEDAFLTKLTHGGVTATGNYNVTAGLATVSFFAIIVAGSRAHGFVGHWKNMVPHGMNPVLTVFLIFIETIGMFVRPFALTMRLAANMSGGHIAILAILSLIFVFAELAGNAIAGIGVGLVALPLAIGVSVLEVIVIGVQAYVFVLLTAVFIGMAIHAHH
jgi:F-type H+-transporting ATPase subunit a